MLLFSNAKLNLRLKIEGRQNNGYHLLSMLNVEIGLSDQITVTPQDDGTQLKVLGNLNDSGLLDPTRNLACKAVEYFNKVFGLSQGLNITLKKNIPLGAGLGGGSSNAAAILKYLAKQHNKDLTPYLSEIALCVGADVPYFLSGGLSHVTGIGEQVYLLPTNAITGESCLLVCPKVNVSTKELYAQYRKLVPESMLSEDIKLRNLLKTNGTLLREHILELIENDFQNIVCDLYPEIKQVILELSKYPELVYALTGSGSTVFCMERSRNHGELTKVKENLSLLGLKVYQLRII